MKRWKMMTAAVAGGAAISAAASVALGRFQWNRATVKAVARLRFNTPDVSPDEFRLYEIARLPAPARRYFRYALQPGQAMIEYTRIMQRGQFRAGGFDAKWSPFEAEQHFTGGTPGFVWDARIHMAPLLTVRVRDSYIRGMGAMQARIASLFPIVDQSGTRDLAAGALHRYLAEAVWLPTALLPSQGVVWEPIDDNNARATLTDHGISVSLEFEFAESGEIVRSYTPQRNRDVNGVSTPTPWTCYYGSYARVGEMMIPRMGGAQWLLPEGKLPYCRLRLNHIAYTRPMLIEPITDARSLSGMEDILHDARLEGEREKYSRTRESLAEPVRSLAESGL